MDLAPNLPAYDDAERLLHQAGVPTSASEAHGIITGVLCAPHGARVAWPALILGRDAAPDDEQQRELAHLFAALHGSTYAHLHGVDCDFAPLLPDDEHSLAEQLDGLSDWCRGFLFGLHAGGVENAQSLPGDAGEIVRDIMRLSEAELDSSLADEEEAKALAEIVEYLRVGVQLIFEELQPPAARH